jgi:hypothetical protein
LAIRSPTHTAQYPPLTVSPCQFPASTVERNDSFSLNDFVGIGKLDDPSLERMEEMPEVTEIRSSPLRA